MTGCRLRETVEQKKKKRGQRHTLESMLGGTNLVPVKKKKKTCVCACKVLRRKPAFISSVEKTSGCCPHVGWRHLPSKKKKKDDLWPGI